MSCPAREEEEQQKVASTNCCKLIPSLIKEACARCHISSCLKSPSLSSDDKDESLPDSNVDNKDMIILEIKSRAMKAKAKKDYVFADSLRWVPSPMKGKIVIAPKGNVVDGEEGEGDNNDDRSEVFYSVKSCFSHSSSEKELNCLKELRGRSLIWEEILHCEGWPFGLWRKALMLPPLPPSPSDSWIWSKKSLGSKVCINARTCI